MKDVMKVNLEGLEYDPKTGVISRIKQVGPVKTGPVLTKNRSGYLTVQINGKNYLQHRLAFAFMGIDPVGKVVDHINGNGFDNRWDNLRLTTVGRNNTTKEFPYVYYCTGKHHSKRPWRVSINKEFHGYYLTEGEAREYVNNFLSGKTEKYKAPKPKGYFYFSQAKKWVVRKQVGKKTKTFGSFKTEKEAKDFVKNKLPTIMAG